MLSKFWLRLLMFSALCVAFVALIPAPLAAVVCDLQFLVTASYDARANHTVYRLDEAAAMNLVSGSFRRNLGQCDFIGVSSGFLAAEATVTVLDGARLI